MKTQHQKPYISFTISRRERNTYPYFNEKVCQQNSAKKR